MLTDVAPQPSQQSEHDAYGAVGRSEWMDVDWPEHLHWVQVEGRWMNYVDIGEGPVALMIHGLSGCWQNWLENIPFFARDHRVIAMDLPGFGESEMPEKTISIDRYADTIDAFLDGARDRPSRCGSSATRWAASSARSSRSATRSASSGSCSSPPPA